MANSQVTNTNYVAEALVRKSQKQNDMVVKKVYRNVELVGGSTYNQGAFLSGTIQSSQPHVLSSISLVANLKLAGYTGTDVKFLSSACDLFSTVSVDFNGYKMVDIPSKAGLVAYVNRNCNRSQERFESDKIQLLSDVDLSGNGTYPIQIPLSVFGLDCTYLLPTGSNGKQKVEINLNSKINEIFSSANPGSASTLSYSLENASLLVEYYELSVGASSILRNSVNSANGLSYPLFSYWVTDAPLDQSTTQTKTVSENFQNITANYLLPMNGGYGATVANGNTCATDGYKELIKWNTAGEIPSQFKGGFIGMESRNLGSSTGQSGRPLALQSLINCSKKNMTDMISGYGWARDYTSSSNFGAIGLSFMRADEKLPELLQSGTNGQLSNGSMQVEINLDTAPSALSKMYCVVEFTRVVTISAKGNTEMK